VCVCASDFYETIMACFLLFAIELKCCGMKTGENIHKCFDFPSFSYS